MAEFLKRDMPFCGLVCQELKEGFPHMEFLPEKIKLKSEGVTVSCENSAVEKRYLDGGYKMRIDFGLWLYADENSSAVRLEKMNTLSELVGYLEERRVSLPYGYSEGVFEIKSAPSLKKRNSLGDELYRAVVSMRFTKI